MGRVEMKFEIDWKGQKYLMEWFDSVDFESLENVTQSYGFVFDDEGRVCIVDCNKGYWTLPGGGVEDYDDSFEDTLIREVDEEADLDIKNIKRVGYFRVSSLSENCEKMGIHHILRYIATVDRVKEPTIDPATGVVGSRKFVRAEDFSKFVNWGDSGKFQLKKALEALGLDR